MLKKACSCTVYSIFTAKSKKICVSSGNFMFQNCAGSLKIRLKSKSFFSKHKINCLVRLRITNQKFKKNFTNLSKKLCIPLKNLENHCQGIKPGEFFSTLATPQISSVLSRPSKVAQ